MLDEKAATGVALITVDADGQNTIVVASGANQRLSVEDIQSATDVFAKAKVLVTQLESPLKTVKAALSLAREYHLPVILNPAPAIALDTDLLAMVDYLIPNEHEVLLLAGENTLENAINKLLSIGVSNLIITLGDKGVWIISAGARKHIPAHAVKAIDTVAAGDAFVGAFATALAEGLEVEQAVCLGNAAAAISVTRRGAQPSIPNRKEVEMFLDAQKK